MVASLPVLHCAKYCREYALYFAEGKRFELLVGCPTQTFQVCALDRYANPPYFVKDTLILFKKQFIL